MGAVQARRRGHGAGAAGVRGRVDSARAAAPAALNSLRRLFGNPDLSRAGVLVRHGRRRAVFLRHRGFGVLRAARRGAGHRASGSNTTAATPARSGRASRAISPMELLWSVIPTVIAMVMFGWGASVFYHLRRPPDEAMHIYAVGKQWMWKFQHLEGQREINELHVPVGRADQDHGDVRGCAAQPVFPVLPHQDRRHSRPLHGAVVRGHQGRDLSHLLRRVLRHQSLRDDRFGDRDGAGGVSELAGRRRRRIAGRARRGALPAARVQHAAISIRDRAAVRRSRTFSASRSSWPTARR